MPNPQDHVQQLADHIEKNLKKGYTMDSLKFSLMDQGYSRISVDNAIERVNKKLAEDIPIIKEKPQITHKLITEEKGKPKIYTLHAEKKNWWEKLLD